MISRRLILGYAISIPLTACVDTRNYKPWRPYMSLTKILAALPHIQTEEELVAAFGPPDFSRRIQEPGDNISTRDHWKGSFYESTPSDFLDTVSPETKLLAYQIILFDTINPWISSLYVGINSEGRVLGWMHQGSKHEKDMEFSHGIR